jgi:hypothetical protein
MKATVLVTLGGVLLATIVVLYVLKTTRSLACPC